MLGALFILVTLAFPQGIVGVAGKLRLRLRPPAAPVPGEEEAP